MIGKAARAVNSGSCDAELEQSMSTRFAIALLLTGVVSTVLFGAGAITVLSLPRLAEHAQVLLPIVIALSFIVAPMLSWVIAPRLRSRFSRQVEARRALAGRSPT
jgi:hypothetical protein